MLNEHHSLGNGSLEFDIQQDILSDLAANAAKFSSDAEVAPIVDAVASKVQTIKPAIDGVPEDIESRIYMVRLLPKSRDAGR
jgi:TPP-dependent 2-oxoacid decarboxylase